MSNTEYFLLCYTSFITLVNPVGVLPTFMALTDEHSEKGKKRSALEASLILFFGIILFAYLGDYIFRLFGITVDALRIVGGLLLLEMGRDLLHGRPPKMKAPKTTHDANVGVVPLGFPVLLGAGAITLAMVRKSQAVNPDMVMLFFLSVFLVALSNFLILFSSDKISKHIGENGQSVMNRFMGLITMIIAIEFIFAGLRPYAISIGKEILG